MWRTCCGTPPARPWSARCGTGRPGRCVTRSPPSSTARSSPSCPRCAPARAGRLLAAICLGRPDILPCWGGSCDARQQNPCSAPSGTACCQQSAADAGPCFQRAVVVPRASRLVACAFRQCLACTSVPCCTQRAGLWAAAATPAAGRVLHNVCSAARRAPSAAAGRPAAAAGCGSSASWQASGLRRRACAAGQVPNGAGRAAEEHAHGGQARGHHAAADAEADADHGEGHGGRPRHAQVPSRPSVLMRPRDGGQFLPVVAPAPHQVCLCKLPAGRMQGSCS